VVLPIGKYDLVDTKYPWMNGTITVGAAIQQKQNSGISNFNSNGRSSNNNTSNLVIGGFYAPTNRSLYLKLVVIVLATGVILLFMVPPVILLAPVIFHVFSPG
jgi:protein-S-isoprenylcysteine O-methyltransferase Ste14